MKNVEVMKSDAVPYTWQLFTSDEITLIFGYRRSVDLRNTLLVKRGLIVELCYPTISTRWLVTGIAVRGKQCQS